MARDPARASSLFEVEDELHARGYLAHQEYLRRVSETILATRHPDVVVAVIAAGAVLAPHLRALRPEVRFVTCVTDWRGGCLSGWSEPGADVILCPSERNAEYLIGRGAPADKVRITGPIQPRIGTHSLTPAEAAELRRSLGVKAGLPTVIFNTAGRVESVELVGALEETCEGANAIVLCHRRQDVALAARSWQSKSVNVITLEWTDQLDAILQISDIVVTKPGPGLCLEALSRGVALVIDATQPLLTQEVEVHDHLVEVGVAVAIRDTADWQRIATRWTRGGEGAEDLAKMRARATALAEREAWADAPARTYRAIMEDYR